jgi:hypothetical protein
MVLYLCVLIVFSLCQESLKLILTTDPFLRWFCHVIHLLVFALALGGVQPFAYPLAKPSTTWANTDASLMHHVTYRDGSVARAALLRLNPGDYGRCFTFGFFCTNRRISPCADFLLGVAVIYSNRGGGGCRSQRGSCGWCGPPTAAAQSGRAPRRSSRRRATSC